MRTERVAVILVEILNPTAGMQVIRLFDVIEKLESIKDETDGTSRHRVILEIITDERQSARPDGGMIRFIAVGSTQEQTARPRVFMAVRAAVHRDLQTLLGGIHGFFG